MSTSFQWRLTEKLGNTRSSFSEKYSLSLYLIEWKMGIRKMRTKTSSSCSLLAVTELMRLSDTGFSSGKLSVHGKICKQYYSVGSKTNQPIKRFEKRHENWEQRIFVFDWDICIDLTFRLQRKNEYCQRMNSVKERVYLWATKNKVSATLWNLQNTNHKLFRKSMKNTGPKPVELMEK